MLSGPGPAWRWRAGVVPGVVGRFAAELRDLGPRSAIREPAEGVRRRQKGESLRSLYSGHQPTQLSKAYPDSKGKLREKLAVEAFIVGLNNSELALQVRNMSPVDLQGAYRMALMFECKPQFGRTL